MHFFLVLSGVVFYKVKIIYPSGLCHSQRLALLESMSSLAKLYPLLANEGLSHAGLISSTAGLSEVKEGANYSFSVGTFSF